MDAACTTPKPAGGAKISTAPAALDFGPVGLNQAKTKRLIIKNVGAAGSVLSGSITSPPLLPFLITQGGTVSLQKGASHVVEIMFQPTLDTHYTDGIGITSNDPDNPSVSVQISGEVLDHIKVWINAFISREVPPFTRPAPLPFINGETMIVGPLLIAAPYYLTDQRGFDSTLTASARIHSEVEVDVNTATRLTELHRASETVMLGIEPLSDLAITLCARTADLRGSAQFSDPIRFGSAIQFNVNAAGSNPCSPPFTPDIDFSGIITINIRDSTVSFRGLIDDFPAFEMYVSANRRPAKPVFFKSPEPGNNPWNLVGPARRFVDETKSWRFRKAQKDPILSTQSRRKASICSMWSSLFQHRPLFCLFPVAGISSKTWELLKPF